MNTSLNSFIFDTSKTIIIDAEVIEEKKNIPVKIELKAQPHEEGIGWNIAVVIHGDAIQDGEQEKKFKIRFLPLKIEIGTFNPRFYRPQTAYCNIKDYLNHDSDTLTKIRSIPENIFCRLEQNKQDLLLSVSQDLKWHYA